MIRRALIGLYGVLLYCYPSDLRNAHGRDMRQCARDTIARRGPAAALLLFLDLAISVPREWAQLLKGKPMTGIGRDLSYAIRILWRSPGFTLAAVVTLALGIGANTAIFTLADATLLRPLKVTDPARLVAFKWSASLPDYREWAERTDVFSGVAATANVRVNVTAHDATEPTESAFVSANYFQVLGVGASAGRLLGAADDANGAALAAVLDRDWWQAHFNGDPAVVGTTIHVSGAPATIVGIAAKGFRGASIDRTPKLYLPLTSAARLLSSPFSARGALENRGFVWMTAIGRLRDGVTIEAAADAMDAMYVRQHPEDGGPDHERLELVPLQTRALGGPNAGGVYTFVELLAGVVLLTLLIGCANIANLQLARSAARQREIGVRLAIGASRGRIVRQLLTESLVLAALGGALGLGVAWWSLRLLARFQLPGGIDIAGLPLAVDGAALAFALIASAATVLLFGLVPAWQASRGNALAVMRSAARTTARGGPRSALVAGQIALSLVLLTGTALFLQSFISATRVPLGFSPAGVATATLTPSVKGFDRERARRFFETALIKVRQIPGVTAAAWTNVLPITMSMSMDATIEGYRKKPSENTNVYVANVGPEYFEAAGTRLLRGRTFAETDTPAAPLVAVVNETAARRFWSGRDPLQGRIRVDDTHFIQVVGVVEDTKVHTLDEKPVPYVYMPFAQPSGPFAMDRGTLVVRTSGDVDALLPLMREQLRAADPGAPLSPVTTFEFQVRRLVMPQRMGAAFFATFAILALTLAAIGIYGVSSYVAALRTREMGIRIALGADRSRIRALVLRQGAAPVAIGIASGILLAAVASRLAAAFLRGVSPRDPLTYAAVVLVLGAIALAAAWIPARRASKLDPVGALRAE
jgi:predicted permease